MKEVVVGVGQSVFDLAIQHTGCVDTAYDIAGANGITIDAPLTPGTILLVPDVVMPKIVENYRRSGVNIATAIHKFDDEDGEGLEFWYLEYDFVIS